MTTSGSVQQSAFINCTSPLEFIDTVKEICNHVESTPDPDLGILSVNVLGSSVHPGKLRVMKSACAKMMTMLNGITDPTDIHKLVEEIGLLEAIKSHVVVAKPVVKGKIYPKEAWVVDHDGVMILTDEYKMPPKSEQIADAVVHQVTGAYMCLWCSIATWLFGAENGQSYWPFTAFTVYLTNWTHNVMVADDPDDMGPMPDTIAYEDAVRRDLGELFAEKGLDPKTLDDKTG